MNTNRLREAMRAANRDGDLEALDQAAEELGREAVAVALMAPPVELEAHVQRDLEGDRQRLLDAALGDAIEVVARHRLRLGRRVCSRSDATATRQVYELLRAMAGADGGADNDPSFTH